MVKWDRLWPGGLTFAFDDGPFKPSTDTFLLGGFAAPRRNDRVCDLGAGIGLLGLLLLGREPSVRVTDIDIDPAACALAEENLAANGLTGHRVLRADLRRREELPPAGSFDMAVSNPPYFAAGSGAAAAGRGTVRGHLHAGRAVRRGIVSAAERRAVLPGTPGGAAGGADGPAALV